jgi:hypothetical protein
MPLHGTDLRFFPLPLSTATPVIAVKMNAAVLASFGRSAICAAMLFTASLLNGRGIYEIRLGREFVPGQVAFEQHVALDVVFTEGLHASAGTRYSECINNARVNRFSCGRKSVAFDQQNHVLP